MKLIRRGRPRIALSLMAAALFCAYLCFFTTFALFSCNFNGDSCSDGGMSPRSRETVSSNQGSKAMRPLGGSVGGPGSYPPRCTLKCGECSPCRPVHVPVPPGTPVIAEYYPEAWRCKCGNKLFMP